MADKRYKVSINTQITEIGAPPGTPPFLSAPLEYNGVDYAGVVVIEKALIGALGALNDHASKK